MANAPQNAPLARYLTRGINRVQGWCDPLLWQVIEPLAETVAQTTDNAPIAEIGVFQGKFFIGLALTMDKATGHTAFDVFDMQEFNADNAGAGNLKAFQDNLTAHGVAPERVEIMRTDSSWITSNEVRDIVAKTGKFSIFSVDGCHTAHHTMRDLELAMALTHPGGLIFVDDYYNDFWPGVQEGVAKLFLTGAPAFVPLAFLCNKLVLCNVGYHPAYLQRLRQFLGEAHPTTRRKATPRYGFASLSLRPAADGEPLATPLASGR